MWRLRIALALCLAAPFAWSQTAPSRPVSVGVYINDIQDLNLKSHSYSVDLYIWFKWRDKSLDPASTLEFNNPYDLWGHVRTKVYPENRVLSTGEFYQVVRCQGRFSKKLVLEDYPFDRHSLVVEFEDSRAEVAGLQYVVDENSLTLHPELRIPGFQVKKPTIHSLDFQYPTNFGDVGQPARYSRVKIEIPIARPMVAYGAKFMLPVLCVIFCAGLMFLFSPHYVDVRVGIGITALLTVVALQITLNDALPEIDYLVLMDKVYLASYFFVILGLALILRSTQKFDAGQEAEAHRKDRKRLVGLCVLYALALAGIFL